MYEFTKKAKFLCRLFQIHSTIATLLHWMQLSLSYMKKRQYLFGLFFGPYQALKKTKKVQKKLWTFDQIFGWIPSSFAAGSIVVSCFTQSNFWGMRLYKGQIYRRLLILFKALAAWLALALTFPPLLPAFIKFFCFPLKPEPPPPSSKSESIFNRRLPPPRLAPPSSSSSSPGKLNYKF